MDSAAIKKLFEGKKGKVMLIGLGAAGLIGGLAFMRSKSAATAAPSLAGTDLPTQATPSGGTASDASSGGVSADQVGALLGQYADAVGKQIQATNDNVTRLADKTNAQFTQLADATNTALGKQSDALHLSLSDTVTGLKASVADSLYQQASAKVAVDYHDTTDYNSSHPFSGNASTGAVQPLYGYGGVDYNHATADQQSAIAANEKRLDTDPGFVASEISRTNAVIKQREAKGMDTGEQRSYLQGLQNRQKVVH